MWNFSEFSVTTLTKLKFTMQKRLILKNFHPLKVLHMSNFMSHFENQYYYYNLFSKKCFRTKCQCNCFMRTLWKGDRVVQQEMTNKRADLFTWSFDLDELTITMRMSSMLKWLRIVDHKTFIYEYCLWSHDRRGIFGGKRDLPFNLPFFSHMHHLCSWLQQFKKVACSKNFLKAKNPRRWLFYCQQPGCLIILCVHPVCTC